MADAPTKIITTKRGYTRTVTATWLEYQCSWCYQSVGVWRFPGPMPLYCETCRAGEVHATNAAASIRRKREADRLQHPPARRPGRPRKGA